MKLIALPAITLLLSGTASAANCYSQSGGPNCVSKEGMWRAREDFCLNQWQGGAKDHKYRDTNGHTARIRRTGSQTQQECWDSTENIINQCFGNKNGGSYDFTQFYVNINFCA